MGPVKFRRALISRGRVVVETLPAVFYSLPNPTPAGQKYDPQKVLAAIVRVGKVNLDIWEKTDETF